VDDLRVRILNVRYEEADRLHRLRRSEEAGNRNGKYSPHLETDRRRSVVSLGASRRGAEVYRALRLELSGLVVFNHPFSDRQSMISF
jgi:hypothetical protein